MSDPDESRYSPALRGVLAALEACTLAELGALEMYHLRRIKRIVAKREALAAAEKARAERAVILPHLRLIPRDEPTATEPPVPDPAYLAGAVDGKSVPDEDDEPDDENATPLEVVGPPDECDVIEAQAFFRADGGHDEPRGPHQ